MASQGKNLKIALTFANRSVALDPDNLLFKNRLKQIQETCDRLDAARTHTIKSA
jgi:hypothetical protein